MKEKIIKGLFLGVIFGALGYLIFRKVSTACVLALIMFMSMFVRNRNQ